MFHLFQSERIMKEISSLKKKVRCKNFHLQQCNACRTILPIDVSLLERCTFMVTLFIS